MVSAVEEVKKLPISVDPEIMHGVPCFAGTRVPIDALFNNLADGLSLNEILDEFPSIKREHAIALINFANQSMQSAAA